MKIALQLLNTLKRGGAENVALNYASALSEMGVSSCFIAKSHSAEYEAMIRNQNHDIENRLTGDLIAGADYIFIHSNINLLRLIKYKIAAKLKGKKVIYLQHLFFCERKFFILSLLINWICTDFFLITPRTEQLVKKYIRIPVHTFINFYIQRYEKKDYSTIRQTVREELHIADDDLIIMFSAIFKPGMGLVDCLKMASLMSNEPNVKFLIAGEGEEQYLIDEYRGNNIIAVGCVNDVERYLISSDIYLFSSFLQEMLPMALVEAINADLSILAYDTIINRFLLSNSTFESLDDMIKAVEERRVPRGFKHYDKAYALGQFRNILKLS